MQENRTIRRLSLCVLPLFAALSALASILTPAFCGLAAPKLLLAIGGGLMLAAIPLHLLAGGRQGSFGAWRHSLYISAILLNAVGTSLCEAAYYTHLQARPAATTLLLGAALPILAALLFAGVQCLLPRHYAGLTWVFSLITVAGGIASAILWARSNEKIFWSALFFAACTLLLGIIALRYTCDAAADPGGDPWLKFCSYASFGLLIVVAVAVLLILCIAGSDSCDADCDCCDCCDCGSSSSSASRKKARK